MRILRRAASITVLVCSLSAFSATAMAATPSVISTDGASMWSYQDASDGAAKREGGYLRFNDLPGDGYASDGASYSVGGGFYDQADYVGKGPHGGYDTSTNKCKACHAVHRAEGTYYLLRSDSLDDACNYCHIGDSAHSDQIVYTGNDAGIYTPNGHTMGAGAAIPDSTTYMEAREVELRPGDPTTSVKVRQYDTQRKSLYRVVGYGRSPGGHPVYGSAQVRFSRIGPTPLSCSSCHQVHNAATLVWRPSAYDPSDGVDSGGFLSAGYKLLRRFPGASALGDPAVGDPIEAADLAKVPESRLTEDVNYSSSASLESTYTEAGQAFRQPDWVVGQGFSGGAVGAATVVNQYTLSVWCADCHNLNIGGGAAEVGTLETGMFDAHAERTHPVPAQAAVGGVDTGGFQCYSCHRNDLDVGSACSSCHYTPARYRLFADGSDFPHSGSDGGYKLLGAFSVDVESLADGWFDYEYLETTITATNLDAVCLRCHAVRHQPYGTGMPVGHAVPAEYDECTICHASDAAVIHDATPSGCDACHAALELTFDCAVCHPGELDLSHGYDAAVHAAVVGADTISGTLTNTSGVAWRYWSGGTSHPITYSGHECGACHLMDLMAEHTKASSSVAGEGCLLCHRTPRDTFGSWNGTCQQGDCHPTTHDSLTMASSHEFAAPVITGSCGTDDDGCHSGWGYQPDHASTHWVAWYYGGEWGVDLTPYTEGCVFCHYAPDLVPDIPTACTDCHPNDYFGGTSPYPHEPAPFPW